MAKLPYADKELGQHFLRDQKVIEAITSNFKEKADIIIEVGPGPAILSQALSKQGIPYYFIEKDERFKEQLETLIPKEFQYYEDALKFDWNKFIIDKNLDQKKIWLVSNLPYNVSTPLFLSFLKISQIKFMTLMFQKEVGEKTYLKQNDKKQMGSLLSLSLNYFHTKLLLKVNPGSFSPPPKVKSVVVSYSRKDFPTIKIKDFKNFESFLRILFSQRRKQIGSVLKQVLSVEEKENYFSLAEISSQRRSESLSLEEVYSLYKAFGEMK